MFRWLLITGGAAGIYLWWKGRQLTGQGPMANERVRLLQQQLNIIQEQIYQAGVAAAAGSGWDRPPLFFHGLALDGVLGVETYGAIHTLRRFCQLVEPALIRSWELLGLAEDIDIDSASADEMIEALAPLLEWANNIGADDSATVNLTMQLGEIYLRVTGVR